MSEHFKPEEFACKCGCGKNNVSPELVEKLEVARVIYGLPMRINSACRCADHNAKVGGVMASSHIDGFAVDLLAASAEMRYQIVKALLVAGFERIGIGDAFIHADIDPKKPQGVIWLYS